jgi:DNA-binding YbaB/EbfC family protein
MNIQQLMKKAQEMQAKVQKAQQELEEKEFNGEAGGGMVKVTINGKGDMKQIQIDPSLLDPEEKDMLEDLIIVAYNEAKKKASDAMDDVMGSSGISPDMLKNMPF